MVIPIRTVLMRFGPEPDEKPGRPAAGLPGSRE